jgi:hypothetical protein
LTHSYNTSEPRSSLCELSPRWHDAADRRARRLQADVGPFVTPLSFGIQLTSSCRVKQPVRS